MRWEPFVYWECKCPIKCVYIAAGADEYLCACRSIVYVCSVDVFCRLCHVFCHIARIPKRYMFHFSYSFPFAACKICQITCGYELLLLNHSTKNHTKPIHRWFLMMVIGIPSSTIVSEFSADITRNRIALGLWVRRIGESFFILVTVTNMRLLMVSPAKIRAFQWRTRIFSTQIAGLGKRRNYFAALIKLYQRSDDNYIRWHDRMNKMRRNFPFFLFIHRLNINQWKNKGLILHSTLFTTDQ